MILNSYLPPDELQSTLSENEFSSIEFILKNMLEGEKNITSIQTEKELLGQIHHSINLDKYKSKEFRKKLYICSSGILRNIWKKYFEECGGVDIEKYVEFKWGNNERTKKFVSFFNYPDYIIPNDENNFRAEERIIPGNAKYEPLKTIHGYQMPIVRKSLKILKLLNGRCLIQMPTGTGKTRTAMEIVSRLLNENNEYLIIWLANSSELLDQAGDEFKHVWNHVGKYPINLFRIYGTNKIEKIPEKGIIFANYDKLNNLIKNKVVVKPNYIVVDEAHQIIAPMYNHLLRKISNLEKSTRVLGLTATPGRGIDEQQNIALTEEFDQNIVRIELDIEDIKKYDNNVLRYLEEEEEVLAKVNPIPIHTDIPYDLSEEEWNHITALVKGDHPEYSKTFLKKLAENNSRNILIIDKLRELAIQGKKILYFATDLSQSILVFAILQKLGVKAIHVDGTTDKTFRRQIIKKFKETNEINIICNYGILATGFDVPKLDVIFIARPVNSAVLFNQMIGRGTRGIKVGGTSDFILVQIIDKIKNSRFVGFDPYAQYGLWDEHWIK